MAAYALVRFTYRPRLGAILGFVCACCWPSGGGRAWPAVRRGDRRVALALFALLLHGLGRRFKRALGNDDIAFWMVSQRILPPVAVVSRSTSCSSIWACSTRAPRWSSPIVAVNIPIVVWLMRDFFISIPLELEESALIDGASRYRIFWSIVLPLSTPGLAATFILVLIIAWNEYLLALFLSSANAQTLPLTVAAQNATRGPNGGTCRC